MCNSILIGDCILYKPDCNEQNYSSVVKQGIEIVMYEGYGLSTLAIVQ